MDALATVNTFIFFNLKNFFIFFVVKIAFDVNGQIQILSSGMKLDLSMTL